MATPETIKMRGIMLLLLSCILSSFSHNWGESFLDRHEMLQKALSDRSVGKKHVFNSSDKEDFKETQIVYLGAIKSKRKKYKIVSCAFIWGVNRHTNGTIYIFDESNKELGRYQLGDMYDLPNKTSGTKLIFDKIGHTDCNAKTEIDFKNNLPKVLFIKCTSDGGDIYRFQPVNSYKIENGSRKAGSVHAPNSAFTKAWL